MRSCSILALLVALCGCNPLGIRSDPALFMRVIPESEMPDAVKEGVLAAKPNAQIVHAMVTEIGRYSEIVSYDVAVKDVNGNQWFLEMSPDGELMSSLSTNGILDDSEPDP